MDANLHLMDRAKTGYWFCNYCQCIVGVEYNEKKDAQGMRAVECAKCGGDNVHWNPPVFKADEK